jgi:arylsulfatase A-like enzyme
MRWLRWAVLGALAGVLFLHGELAIRLPWLLRNAAEGAPTGWGEIHLAHLALGALGGVLLAALGRAALWLRARAPIAGAFAALAALGALALAISHLAGRTELTREQLVGHVLTAGGGALAFALLVFALGRFAARSGFTRTLAGGLAIAALLGAGNLFWCSRMDLARVVAPIVGDAQSDKPNVLLLTVDTLRADHVGPRLGLTPEIDKLGAEGVVFERAFAQSGWTRPSFGSLMTSRYPSQHGAYVVNDPKLKGVHETWAQLLYNGPLREDVTTAAELFKAAGYTTVAVQANWQASGAMNFDQGFDLFLYDALFEVPFWDRTLLGTYASWLPPLWGAPRRFPFYTTPPDANAVAQVIDEVFSQNVKRPVFLWVNYIDPHSPYKKWDMRDPEALRVEETIGAWGNEPKEVFLEAYGREVAFTDYWFGKSVARLRSANVLNDESIVVISADHGEDFRDHDVEIRRGDGLVVRGHHHGHSTYNELVHVPLAIRAPGRLPAGARVATTVRSIDVLPTLVELAGIKATPNQFEGTSLVALARGNAEAAPRISFAERVYYGLAWNSAQNDAAKRVMRTSADSVVSYEDWDQRTQLHESIPLTAPDPALTQQLAAFMQRMESEARKAGVTESGVSLDRESQEQLKALGYVQ